MSVAESARGFDVGRVISNAMSAIGGNFPIFALLALAFYIIPQVVLLTALGPLGARVGIIGVPSWIEIWLPTLARYILQNLLLGAVLQAAAASLSRTPTSFADCAKTGFTNFFPLLNIAILSGIGELLGFLLFIIPGVLLLIRWSLAGAARVVEGKNGVDALGRSAELTLNHRGAIFAIRLLAALVLFVAGVVANAPFLKASGGPGLEAMMTDVSIASIVHKVVTISAAAMSTVISTALTAATYFELRRVKEGVSVNELAAAFD